MATITQRGAAFQLRVTHKLLPRALYATFDTHVEAYNYGAQLEAMLSRGVVPQELLSLPKAADDPLVISLISAYCGAAPALTDSDDALLSQAALDGPLVGLRLSALTYRWVETYVAWLKSPDKHLAPSSIRKRIGALGRVLDWHIKRTTPDNTTPMANVLRMLPRGYSAYSKVDATLALAKRDVARNRRLSADEAAQIARVLAGEKRDDRERAFTDDAAFALLYQVLVDTGMRLLEAVRLRVEAIDLDKNLIHVDGSKGHRGELKPRWVPIKPALRAPLAAWCAGRVGLVFPYWDGSKAGQREASNRLSKRFTGLFDYAQVEYFTAHDLRHHAACLWFEMRHADGRWVFSEIEICKILGWTDTRMAIRYASLRGEDLAARMG